MSLALTNPHFQNENKFRISLLWERNLTSEISSSLCTDFYSTNFTPTITVTLISYRQQSTLILKDAYTYTYNSASSTFYAPSDICGIQGKQREFIRSTPNWRKEGPSRIVFSLEPTLEIAMTMACRTWCRPHIVIFIFQLRWNHLSVCRHMVVRQDRWPA